MSKAHASKDNWSEEEISILFQDRLQNVPYVAIGQKLNRTADAVRNKWRRTNWAGIDHIDRTKADIAHFKIEEEKNKVDISVKNSLDKFRLRADVIGDKLSQAIDKLPTANLVSWTPRRKLKNQHSPEDMVLVFSDLHIGHEHSLEETGGLSEYSIEVFKNRLQNLQHAVADIYEIHSHLYEIPRLHIVCLGDIVDGMNNVGAWSPVYISTPIYDQVMLGFQYISETIYYWLTIFPEIHFYGLRGNHGRIAQSGQEKDNNNWDIIVYDFLKTKFENNPRVHFHVPKTWWMVENIRSHNFLMIHGDDIKGQNPPLKSLADFERKMAGMLDRNPHYTIAGHFHNAAELTTHHGKVIMNGSFVGADVYSLRNAMPGNRPEQKLFGVHDEHGVTWTYNINLNLDRKNKT